MEQFTIEEVRAAVDGQLLQDGKQSFISGVSIDSRKVIENDLYIPIIGEKQDGHIFIPGALQNGASAVLTMQADIDVPSDCSVILVKDTVRAIQALAAVNRRKYDIPVVAVTGSSGKTTTKDVIASVLSQKYHTMKTQGNFNNYLGVPQTILQLDRSCEAAVVETGMGRIGEIAETIDEILPHYTVITNIGTAHLEFLKTRENILKAKMEALSTLKPGDFAVLNGDDPWLNRIQDTPYSIIRVGIGDENSDLGLKARILSSGAQGISFETDGETYHFRFPGKHNVYNCLSAIYIGKDLGLTAAEIQQGFDAFMPSGNRMKIESFSGITYIDDSYNANPDAMRAALNTLYDMGAGKRKRIAVLGDMLEMGENTGQLHYEVGRAAGEKADVIIAVGSLAKNYIEGAKNSCSASDLYHCDDADAAELLLKKITAEGDIVLIKASNGVGLKQIMQKIKGE